MIFVGVDIAKLNHFASAISSDGEKLIEPFQFSNDADGFRLLISNLVSFEKDSIIIGLESTAHYGDNLVRYLVAQPSLFRNAASRPVGLNRSFVQGRILPWFQCDRLVLYHQR